MSSENSHGAEGREVATELLDRLSKQRERLLNALAAVGEDNRQSPTSRPYRRTRSDSQEGGAGSTMDQEKLIKELSDGLQPELWLRSLNLCAPPPPLNLFLLLCRTRAAAARVCGEQPTFCFVASA
eukprot:2333114-Rhodomonas_salina.1